MSQRPRRRLVRRSNGGQYVEAMVVIAVITILVTRAYLAATGYPQVGGGDLHIAHALWGGAGMVIALVAVLSLLGPGPRHFAVLIGGIGFGLFLDEVGKFVTKTNDYFFAPSVSIMYVVLVVILLVNHEILDRLGLSPAASLGSAAAIAQEGLMSGLTPAEYRRAQNLLTTARDGGADDRSIAATVTMLDACPQSVPGRAERVSAWFRGHPVADLGGARMTMVAAALLALFSWAGVVSAVATIAEDVSGGLGPGIVTVGQFLGSALAAALCSICLPLLRRGTIGPVRLLRLAALITILLTEVFNFVAQEFGALINVAVGLLALAVFTYRMQRLRQAAADEAAAPA